MNSTGLQRYFIHFSFVGTRYHGWQVQPNALTVQEVLEEGLGRILRSKVLLTGCGRTDAGVHARMFYAHFDFPQQLDPDFLAKLAYKLNAYLPRDIAVERVFLVDPRDHARFSALSRTYQYHLLTVRDPFLDAYAWDYHFGPLDLNRLNLGAAMLLEHEDFACFSKRDTDIVGTRCTLSDSFWEATEHGLVYTVTANRFLRNMVRAIVGSLLELGKGKWGENKLRQVLESGDRCQAGESVPARGLSLVKVVYPQSITGNS